MFMRSRFIARIRSFTDPYRERIPPDKMADVVIRTTGATMASIALIAIGFTELDTRASEGTKNEPFVVPLATVRIADGQFESSSS